MLCLSFALRKSSPPISEPEVVASVVAEPAETGRPSGKEEGNGSVFRKVGKGVISFCAALLGSGWSGAMMRLPGATWMYLSEERTPRFGGLEDS